MKVRSKLNTDLFHIYKKLEKFVPLDLDPETLRETLPESKRITDITLGHSRPPAPSLSKCLICEESAENVPKWVPWMGWQNLIEHYEGKFFMMEFSIGI